MSNSKKSKDRKGEVERSASPNLSAQFGAFNLDKSVRSLTNSRASSNTDSLAGRAGSQDRHRTRSTDRRLDQDLTRGARERTPSTGDTDRGRQGRGPREPSRQHQHIPHPTDPDFRKFPVELQVMSFERLRTTEIAQCYRQDSHYKDVIDEFETDIAESIIARETARIKDSYNFEGRSFIDALQWWTCQKGIIMNKAWLFNISTTFVLRYMENHKDADPSVSARLRWFTFSLLNLYVFKHTSPEILNNIPWGYDVICDNVELKDFCDDEPGMCKSLKELGSLPAYAKIQSADNYVERVMTDPQIFGGVTGRQLATVEGRFRLTALSLEVSEFPIRPSQTYWVIEQHFIQSSNLVESFLYDVLKLPRLATGLAYYVDGSEHLYSVDIVVQRFQHDKKAVRPLDKAAILEKIKVM